MLTRIDFDIGLHAVGEQRGLSTAQGTGQRHGESQRGDRGGQAFRLQPIHQQTSQMVRIGCRRKQADMEQAGLVIGRFESTLDPQRPPLTLAQLPTDARDQMFEAILQDHQIVAGVLQLQAVPVFRLRMIERQRLVDFTEGLGHPL